MIRGSIVSALVAAAAVIGLAGSASAGPVSSGALMNGLSNTSSLAEQVHYRPFRHCHWRRGIRRCHSGYGYYGPRRYGYYGGPSIYLRFGDRHRHHRHDGHRGHHRRHR